MCGLAALLGFIQGDGLLPGLISNNTAARPVGNARSAICPAMFSTARFCKIALPARVLASASGCFVMRPSSGGGQTSFRPPRAIDAADIALPPGYRIEAVATGLTFPTGVAFDGAGRPHVTEAGYCCGEVWTTPRLLRVEPGGGTRVVARGGQWAVARSRFFRNGAFFVAEGSVLEGGRILRISPDAHPK